MSKKISNKLISDNLKKTALMMAVTCVRNTVIEDYHAGISPSSKTGDYSDVKVVTPFGEIPWNEVSQLNNKEMMAFNREVVDKLYTYLQFLLNPNITEDERNNFMKYPNEFYPFDWDQPKLDKEFIGIKNKNNKKFKDM